jgi:membrane protease YdiL (CAAX protease family)
MRLIEHDHHGVVFIGLTLLWTWGVLSVPVIAGLSFSHPLTKLAYILAGASPSVLALAFVFLTKDQTYQSAFLHRIIGFDLIDLKAYAFILLFVPAVAATSLLAETAISGSAPDLSVLNSYLHRPLSLLGFAGITLIFGPLAEELGWRGYLFDRLADSGVLAYGILIGLVWSIWHLPMFLISGTYQNALLERGFLPVICFFLSTMALGTIMGELSARNHHSILAAILFHFTINFTGELVPLTTTGALVRTGIYLLSCTSLLLRG